MHVNDKSLKPGTSCHKRSTDNVKSGTREGQDSLLGATTKHRGDTRPATTEAGRRELDGGHVRRRHCSG
jgi:hypothetical protein